MLRDEIWRTHSRLQRQKDIVNVSGKAPGYIIHKCFTFVISQPRVVARPGSLRSCNSEAERRGAAGGSRPKLSAWPWTTKQETEPAATTTRSSPISTSLSATAGRRPLTRRTRSRTWNSRVSGGTFVTSRRRWAFIDFTVVFGKFFRLFNIFKKYLLI